MVTYKILCKHFGENADTARDPIREYAQADLPLLVEKAWRCANAGFDMPVEINLYSVVDVALPDWMTVDEYIRDRVKFRYFVGFGGDLSWGRTWFYRLTELPEALRYCCIKLLKVKNFRSDFRKSLREQLERWLNAESVEHSFPFSTRQMDFVISRHDILAARSTSSSIYYAR